VAVVLSANLERLLAAIRHLSIDLPPVQLEEIASRLPTLGAKPLREAVMRLGTSSRARERLGALVDALAENASVSSEAVALALRASGRTAERLAAEQRFEIAWTGPGTETVPLRRVDQVLYELVETSKKGVLLVSYAAYKAEKAMESLRRAAERGVRVELVMELSQQSGGKIAFDSVDEIRANVPQARIFYWPLEKRPANESRRYGSMHAKCLVVDGEAALISSANLTDNALELNMELGLLIRGGTIPARLAEHFNQLMSMGTLQPVPNPE